MSKKIDNLEKKEETFLHFSPKNLFNLDSYFYDLIYSHKDDTPKFHRIFQYKMTEPVIYSVKKILKSF